MSGHRLQSPARKIYVGNLHNQPCNYIIMDRPKKCQDCQKVSHHEKIVESASVQEILPAEEDMKVPPEEEQFRLTQEGEVGPKFSSEFCTRSTFHRTCWSTKRIQGSLSKVESVKN
ncbi:hypothetical protein Tco_0128088 [Tanacetum coccineum]